MRKNHFSVLVVALVVITLLVLWGGYFYYHNLRGIKPVITDAPYDIADVIDRYNKIGDEDTLPPDNTTDFPLTLPDGFRIEVFADNVPNARVMVFDPQGALWVSQAKSNAVSMLEVENGRVTKVSQPLQNLNRPHGLAFDPENPYLLYIATEDALSRVATYSEGGSFQKILDIPTGGRHYTRTIEFGPDKQMYMSIGSTCDVCEEENPVIGTIQRVDLEKSALVPFATGLRNSVFFDWHPETREMWATEMGRDRLGDDLPPDEVNRIVDGGWYGWPWLYGKNVRDEEFESGRTPSFAQEAIESAIDLPAHVAPLGITFVTKDSGWPEEYIGDMLVAYHGSWNRTDPVGYKIARFEFDKNGAVERESDFISGWLTKENEALGRPVDLLMHDGSLYISDDKAGLIYRVYPYTEVESKGGTCVRTGCSGQICADADEPSTCEYSPSYQCFDYAVCERQPDGACGWTQTNEYDECIVNVQPDRSNPVGNVEEKNDIISVSNLEEGGVLPEEFVLEGAARDWWYDEDGLFLVSLLDANGSVFGRYDALAVQAVGDREGDVLVPFRASLVFSAPETESGFIRLERTNPPPLGAFQDPLVFPVLFR